MDKTIVPTAEVTEEFSSLSDYNSIVEYNQGWLAQLRSARITHDKPPDDAVPLPRFVSTEYIVIRDVILLAASTNYQGTKWSHDPFFYSPDEMFAKSHDRIKDHLAALVQTDPSAYATRPAYFVNMELFEISLRAAELWECIAEEHKSIFSQPGRVDSINKIGSLAHYILKGNGTQYGCDSDRRRDHFIKIDQAFNDTLDILHAERGLTKQCCGNEFSLVGSIRY